MRQQKVHVFGSAYIWDEVIKERYDGNNNFVRCGFAKYFKKSIKCFDLEKISKLTIKITKRSLYHDDRPTLAIYRDGQDHLTVYHFFLYPLYLLFCYRVP